MLDRLLQSSRQSIVFNCAFNLHAVYYIRIWQIIYHTTHSITQYMQSIWIAIDRCVCHGTFFYHDHTTIALNFITLCVGGASSDPSDQTTKLSALPAHQTLLLEHFELPI